MNSSVTKPKQILPNTSAEGPKKIFFAQEKTSQPLLTTPKTSDILDRIKRVTNEGVIEIERRFSKDPAKIDVKDIRILEGLANTITRVATQERAIEQLGAEDLSGLSDAQIEQMLDEQKTKKAQ
jgi:hypothetical protein